MICLICLSDNVDLDRDLSDLSVGCVNLHELDRDLSDLSVGCVNLDYLDGNLDRNLSNLCLICE